MADDKMECQENKPDLKRSNDSQDSVEFECKKIKNASQDESKTKIEMPEINPNIEGELSILKKLFSDSGYPEKLECVTENFTVKKKPFTTVQLRNFVHDEKTLHSIQNVASSLALNSKNNDMMSFKQSEDLKNYPNFANVVEFFRKQVKPLIEKITGFQLNDRVALTISKYETNDYLLCHDDQIEKRKIAFILYLVDEEWQPDHGGQLDLFSITEDDNQPSNIVESLNPQRNTLAFFEVQPISFHQVSEVLTKKSARWSINGWFHSDVAKMIEKKFNYPCLYMFPQEHILDEDLDSHFYEWINPNYLDNGTQKRIRKYFCLHSEIQLPNFINDEKYEQVASALKSSENVFQELFRPIFCRFDYVDEKNFSKLPEVLQEFFLLIHSESFYKLISKITGLSFDGGAKKSKKTKSQVVNVSSDEDENDAQTTEKKNDTGEKTAKVDESKPPQPSGHLTQGSMIRWNHGSYTLASDVNPQIKQEALDIDFFFNVTSKSTKQFGEQELIELSDSDSVDEVDGADGADDASGGDDEKRKSQIVEKKDSKENGHASVVESTATISQIDAPASTSTSSATPSLLKTSEPKVIDLDEEESVTDSFENDDDDESSDDNDDDGENENDDEDDEDEDDDDETNDDKYHHTQHDFTGPSKGGGYLAYIVVDQNHQILEVPPTNNFLNIVYRRYKCQRFMKYIDRSNTKAPFHQISVTFIDKKLVDE